MDLGDVADVLRRLEDGGPGLANAVRHAADAPDAGELAAAWMTERGWKRGDFPCPPPGVLAVAFQRWLDARGLDVGATARGVANELKRRFRAVHRRGMRGYLMRKEDADGLWLLAAEVAPHLVARRGRRAPKRLRVRVARQPPPFHPVPHNSRPVLSSVGEVYPSAVSAGEMLRCCPVVVRQAATRGGAAAGRLWRYLAPEEVPLVPPETRAGDRCEGLLWRGTVSVHCARCGAAADGRTDEGHPHPGFPPTPGDAKEGGPSRTFSSETK